jgi:hypothetical protein
VLAQFFPFSASGMKPAVPPSATMTHTARIQSSIVPVNFWGLVVGLINVPVVGDEPCDDEHPANMAMATMAANPSTLFICTAPRVRWARAKPIYAALPFNQNDETLSTLTNMPWPVPSFVKRVPSPVGQIVQPLML